ncbi:MAG TPA: hypothetical protein ENI23_04470 [bacterium]|nr:hypothetical protein [bacterium]
MTIYIQMDKLYKHNKAKVLSIISHLNSSIKLEETDKNFWVLIGSYAINGQKDNSDMDLFYFSESLKHPTRLKEKINGVLVSLCMVPTSSLESDGLDRKYGGYFVGKLLHPYVLIKSNVPQAYLEKYSSAFIIDFVGYIAKSHSHKVRFTEQELCSLVFLAFLSIHPEFDSYFMRFYLNPEFDSIWSMLSKRISRAFIRNKYVHKRKDDKYSISQGFKSHDEYRRARYLIGVRHSAFGSHFHNNDVNFQNKHIELSSGKKKELDPTGIHYSGMISFLSELSGVDSLIF